MVTHNYVVLMYNTVKSNTSFHSKHAEDTLSLIALEKMVAKKRGYAEKLTLCLCRDLTKHRREVTTRKNEWLAGCGAQ